MNKRGIVFTLCAYLLLVGLLGIPLLFDTQLQFVDNEISKDAQVMRVLQTQEVLRSGFLFAMGFNVSDYVFNGSVVNVSLRGDVRLDSGVNYDTNVSEVVDGFENYIEGPLNVTWSGARAEMMLSDWEIDVNGEYLQVNFEDAADLAFIELHLYFEGSYAYTDNLDNDGSGNPKVEITLENSTDSQRLVHYIDVTSLESTLNVTNGVNVTFGRVSSATYLNVSGGQVDVNELSIGRYNNSHPLFLETKDTVVLNSTDHYLERTLKLLEILS